MISLINLDFLKLNVVPIVAVASFATGLFVSHLYHSAIESHQNKELLAQVEKQRQVDNSVIKSYQDNVKTLQDQYISLGEKYSAIKITDVPCKLTPAAVSLWNQSNSSQASVPADTRGVVSGTTTSGVAVDAAIENKLENDKACNLMREELTAIKQWKKETYGE